MLDLNRKLAKLEEEGKKIKVALIGAGHMGNGMVSQMANMKGIEASIVVDIDLELAHKAFTDAGIDEEIIDNVTNEKDAEIKLQEGKVLTCNDFLVACKTKSIDVVIDATGGIAIGAEIALNSILNKKHIVMLNAETDCVVGPILKKLADDAGVIFTGSAGDEPGAVMELFDFADAMGFEVRVIGKGKNNKLDLDCNPDTVREEAERKGAGKGRKERSKKNRKTLAGSGRIQRI